MEIGNNVTVFKDRNVQLNISRLSNFKGPVSSSGISMRMANAVGEKYILKGKEVSLSPHEVFITNGNETIEAEIKSEIMVEGMCLFISNAYYTKYFNSIFNPKPLDENDPEVSHEIIEGCFNKNLLNLNLPVSVLQFNTYSDDDFLDISTIILNQFVFFQKKLHDGNIIHKKLRVPESLELLKRLQTVKEFIDSNWYQKLDLDTLIKIGLLSKFYLCHNFKKVFGSSPIHYHNSLRIKKSLTLLKNMSLPEIAEHLNYPDYPSFSKAFKKYHGVAPSLMKTHVINE